MKYAVLILALLWPMSVQAHKPICATYKAVEGLLRGQYQEQRTRVGYSQTPSGELVLIEMWESEGANTFTINMVYSNGWTCLLTMGKELRFVGKDKRDGI